MDETTELAELQPINGADLPQPNVHNKVPKILLFTLCALVSFAAVIFGMKMFDKPSANTENQNAPTNSPSVTPSNSLAPTILSTPMPTIEASTTKLHVTTNEKFFGDYSYPQEITDLRDDSLIGFTCSNVYFYDYQLDLYYDQTNYPDLIELQDTKLIDYLIKENNENSDNPISAFQACQTDSGETILLLEQSAGGAGTNTIIRIGYLKDNSLTPEIIIENSGDISAPYFTFDKLVALTTTGDAYLQVSGVEMYFSRLALLKFNLLENTNNIIPVFICTQEPIYENNSDEIPETKISCK